MNYSRGTKPYTNTRKHGSLNSLDKLYYNRLNNKTNYIKFKFVLDLLSEWSVEADLLYNNGNELF